MSSLLLSRQQREQKEETVATPRTLLYRDSVCFSFPVYILASEGTFQFMAVPFPILVQKPMQISIGVSYNTIEIMEWLGCGLTIAALFCSHVRYSITAC